MKRRYSIWRFRFRGFETKAMRRLGKTPDDAKMEAGDWVTIVAVFVIIGFDALPDVIPYRKEISYILAVLLFLLGIFLKYRRLAPRTCWRRATWASAGIATVWSSMPWLLYLSGDLDYSEAVYVSLCSLAMWVASLVCFLRLRYIRRRSRVTIALMRMRRNRRRVTP